VPILGATKQKWGILQDYIIMQNDKISTLCVETEHSCTLGTFVGKESHFKISVYAPVKPGNYETPPTEQLDWPISISLSMDLINMLQSHS